MSSRGLQQLLSCFRSATARRAAAVPTTIAAGQQRSKTNGQAALMGGFLFDLDGTLVATDHIHFLAWQQLGNELGFTISEAEYKQTISGRTNAPVLREIRPDLPGDEVKRLSIHKEQVFRDLLGENAEPIPGVVDFLEAIDDAGIPKCIVTNAPRINVDLMLSASGLDRLFPTSHQVLADLLPRTKPDPLPYLEGLKLLGVCPEHSLAFEDSIAGATAAIRANIKTVGMLTLLDREPMMQAGTFATAKDYTLRNIGPVIEAAIADSEKQSS